MKDGLLVYGSLIGIFQEIVDNFGRSKDNMLIDKMMISTKGFKKALV